MTIQLQQLARVSGGEQILHPLSLTLESGSIHTLLGPIRAGKTSLMRLMAGLDKPSAGRILHDGVDVTGVDVRRRGVSMVYQQFINYPNFSVFDNIASPLVVAGKLARAARDALVHDMAARLGLSHLLARLPAELSGGQQQRVALARAMVTDSRLLLLDEPLVNLDYKLREDLRAEMKQLFRGSNRIVVYATTEPQEALMLGGQTIVLREGRLVQQGASLAVYRAPCSLEAARLISDPPMNFFAGVLTGQEIRLADGLVVPVGGGFEGVADGSYTFGLHAAHLSLAGGAGMMEMPVTIELGEINGSETLLHGRYHDFLLLLQEEGVHDTTLGQPMRFYFDPARLYVFGPSGALVRAPRFQPIIPGEDRHGTHSAA